MAGDYYFAVGLGELRDGILRGVPVPIRFSIAVNGEVQGAPEYVEADAELSLSPTAGATPEPSDLSPATEIPAETGDDATDVPPTEADPAGSALPLVGGALLVVGAVGAGVYAAVRRR